MISLLRKVKEFFINDPNVLILLANKFLVIFSNVVTVIFITSFFSKESQGYYFTFQSILNFQTFLELGFGIVLAQFISHEWAFLGIKNGFIQGPIKNLANLKELVKLGSKWYRVVSLLFILFITPIGYLFLASKGAEFNNHLLPWILLCLSSSFSIICMAYRYMLEGSNQIFKSQQSLLIARIVSTIIGWICLFGGLELYSFCIMNLLMGTIDLLQLRIITKPFNNIHINSELKFEFSWAKDFWPQQWKIATSWLCGYLIYQSFVPIIFYIKGPIEAGKMGATLQIYLAIFSLGFIWINAVSPQFGILGAKGDISGLKKLVNRAFKNSLIATSAISICTIVCFILFDYFNLKQIERFESNAILGLLLLNACIVQLQNTEVTAIWYQKKEPFTLVFILSACLILLVNITVSYFYGTLEMTITFIIISNLIILPWCHIIYIKTINAMNKPQKLI